MIHLIHLAPFSLWSAKRKLYSDPEQGSSQWVYRCHYLTIYLLKPSNAQPTYLSLTPLPYDLPFDEEKKKEQKTYWRNM